MLSLKVVAVIVGAGLMAALLMPFASFVHFPFVVGVVGPAAVALAILLLVVFRRPILAMYAALFLVILPTGLIPPSVHSFLNRITTVAALVIWLFAVITQGYRVVVTPATLLMAGFIAWSSVTLAWGNDLELGTMMIQVYLLRFILYLVLVTSLVRTQKDLDGLMFTLAINGWVLITVSILSVLIEGYVPGTRLKVLQMNENELGVLALATMPGVFWHAMQPSRHYKRIARLLAAAFVILTIGLIGMSGSRGSAISAVVTLFAFLFWKPTRRWGKLGLTVIVLAAIAAPFIFSTTFERFMGTAGDTALGLRESLWEAGWEIINKHPIRGVGAGNSPLTMRTLTRSWDQDVIEIHNPVMVVWSETGILGLFLYLGALVSALWSFVSRYRIVKGQEIDWLLPYFGAIGSVFIGYMASWIKGGGAESDFIYFLMLALLMIPACLDQNAYQANEPSAAA